MMMKSDVMNPFDEIKVATRYKYQGQITDEMPFDAADDLITPVYIPYLAGQVIKLRVLTMKN